MMCAVAGTRNNKKIKQREKSLYVRLTPFFWERKLHHRPLHRSNPRQYHRRRSPLRNHLRSLNGKIWSSTRLSRATFQTSVEKEFSRKSSTLFIYPVSHQVVALATSAWLGCCPDGRRPPLHFLIPPPHLLHHRRNLLLDYLHRRHSHSPSASHLRPTGKSKPNLKLNSI